MTKLFRVTPLEKNSAQHFIDLYKKNAKGEIKGWSVTETYRWGVGFREIDDPVTEREARNKAICNSDVCSSGGGSDLRDGSTVEFEYGDSISKKERSKIEKDWHEGNSDGISGSSYILGTSEHGWEIEEESITILSPFRIDIVEADRYGDMTVLEENIKPSSEK
jgi:hypothetical protein